MHKKTYTIQDLVNYKIAVLCGGTSNEREVSLQSGKGIYQALKNSNLSLDVTLIDPSEYDLINLKKEGFNLIFNTLHGRSGEDGSVQGFLEVLGIKYTGCKTLQSALTLDKNLTKKVWLASNIPTAQTITLTKKEINNKSYNLDQLVAELGLPIFVKPNLEGSSVGISKAKSKEELVTALEQAATLDNIVLCERFLDGKEYSVPVLNGKALAAIEIVIDSEHEYYDYDAKYIADTTQYLCPAPLSEEDTAKILSLAEQAANAVGIKSWCRIDILSNSKGEFFALEVNTNPGMTSHSLLPIGAAHHGISYTDLCLQVLLNAINDVELE